MLQQLLLGLVIAAVSWKPSTSTSLQQNEGQTESSTARSKATNRSTRPTATRVTSKQFSVLDFQDTKVLLAFESKKHPEEVFAETSNTFSLNQNNFTLKYVYFNHNKQPHVSSFIPKTSSRLNYYLIVLVL